MLQEEAVLAEAMESANSQPGWQALSPSDGNYLFGYYDRNPWDADISRHLALRIPESTCLPQPGETAGVGYLKRVTEGRGHFVKCAETRAWCHQQGAMQQWMTHLPGAFVYNDFDPQERRLVAQVFQPGKGIVGRYEVPLYIVAPGGKVAATLNFSRIPRRGYSYAEAPLPEGRNATPDLDGDGIFLVDMENAESEILCSYRDIIAAYPHPEELENRYCWLNHPGFSPEADKLLFLFRHCDDPHNSYPWSTSLYTVNVDGTNLRCILENSRWQGKISHQLWGRNSNEILLDANWRGRGHEYVTIEDKPDSAFQVISSGQGVMSHLIFSPDGNSMLADTYPGPDGEQKLAMVDVKTGECKIIGKFTHNALPDRASDLRCDLHPRWSADGRLVTVDSFRGSMRQIFIREV